MLGISFGRSIICGAPKRDIEAAITLEKVLRIGLRKDVISVGMCGVCSGVVCDLDSF